MSCRVCLGDGLFEHAADCPTLTRHSDKSAAQMVRVPVNGVHHLGWDEHARRGTRPAEAEDTTTSQGTW